MYVSAHGEKIPGMPGKEGLDLICELTYQSRDATKKFLGMAWVFSYVGQLEHHAQRDVMEGEYRDC